jgi:hypothetical protein
VIRRILPLGGIIAAALVLAPATHAGQGIGGCVLDGDADFSKGLTTTAQDFNYSFAGTLANCQGSFGDAGGTVSAGKPITIGGIAYKPISTPTGNGSCVSSTTSGDAFVDWGGGKYSVIEYDTTGAAAAVALTGSFKSGSQTLTSVATNPQTGQPVSVISVPLAYGDDYTGGPVAFEPPDPTACNGAGVTTAGIQGVLGHGNYQ